MTGRSVPDAGNARLIERLSSGEPEAWRLFIERYRRLIYSAIHRANASFGGEWDETALDELFEEALYKLLRDNGRALRSWRGQCRLETWIYRIVRNVCVDRIRKEGRRREVAPSDERRTPGERGRARGGERGRLATGSPSPEASDLRISLEQAIAAALSDREALAVKLIYFEGFTYREVAQRMGVTVGAMSGLVYRALAKLKASGGLREQGGRR